MKSPQSDLYMPLPRNYIHPDLPQMILPVYQVCQFKVPSISLPCLHGSLRMHIDLPIDILASFLQQSPTPSVKNDSVMYDLCHLVRPHHQQGSADLQHQRRSSLYRNNLANATKQTLDNVMQRFNSQVIPEDEALSNYRTNCCALQSLSSPSLPSYANTTV